MPNRVHLSTSCCEINCGGQADIAIIIQHTKPPKINHDLVANVCERPAVVARCPVAAIRPALVNGKPSLEVDEKKCICCGACYPPCPPMQINDPEHSKLAIWVGGKNSNARGKPTFMKMVASGLPNNPPRWPEVNEVVKKHPAHLQGRRPPWERLADWIDRIGWPRFFEKTGLPFTKYLIDDWRGSRANLNAPPHPLLTPFRKARSMKFVKCRDPHQRRALPAPGQRPAYLFCKAAWPRATRSAACSSTTTA
jgi:sulfite reductase beta subunit